MFGEAELRVLGVLDTSKKRQEIADATSYTPQTVTNTLKHLEKFGLVRRERQGNETLVSPADTRCVEIYQSLIKAHPHVDFPDLLTSSMLTLLYYLNADDPVAASDLVDESGLARATVYRHVDTLTNRAMAVKNHSQYRLTSEFSTLHEFAYELRHHLHRIRIRNDLGSGTLVWESHDEFLVRTRTQVEDPNYHRTGLDAFAEYGLEFFTTSDRYYLYGKDRESLTPADLVCHLLLIENDARHRKYAMLLVAATQASHEEIRETAEYYGVDATVAPLLEYLRTRGETSSPQTPPWKEMQSLANDYGVGI